jgi:hypothetical protein
MKKVSKHHDEEGYEDDIVGKVEGSSTSFSRSMAAWQHGSMAAWQHSRISLMMSLKLHTSSNCHVDSIYYIRAG